jgi:hypothetical protein
MDDLKALNDNVATLISKQDGSWLARREMLDAVEQLRIAAMGPADYISSLRYQVGLPFHGVRPGSMLSQMELETTEY